MLQGQTVEKKLLALRLGRVLPLIHRISMLNGCENVI